MDINSKLDCCNRIYMERAVKEARNVIDGLTAFLADTSDTNTARIEFAYRDFIRAKNIADTFAAHKE